MARLFAETIALILSLAIIYFVILWVTTTYFATGHGEYFQWGKGFEEAKKWLSL